MYQLGIGSPLQYEGYNTNNGTTNDLHSVDCMDDTKLILANLTPFLPTGVQDRPDSGMTAGKAAII